MKHKHAEVLHAFADGIECEGWLEKTQQWLLITDLNEFEYSDKVRIKPEPKLDIVRYAYISAPNQITLDLTNRSFQFDNVQFTWDGETGELKSAEVIK